MEAGERAIKISHSPPSHETPRDSKTFFNTSDELQIPFQSLVQLPVTLFWATWSSHDRGRQILRTRSKDRPPS
jgi:hypothetical protein